MAIVASRETVPTDDVIANSGIDAIIHRVSRKADISEQAATVAVDEVLTAVKQKLPANMASRLVEVVAGEFEFQSNWDRSIGRLRRVAAAKLQTFNINHKLAGIRDAAVQTGDECWNATTRIVHRLWTAITDAGPGAGR